MKILSLSTLLWMYALIMSSPANAAISLTHSGMPAQMTQGQEIELDVQMTGATESSEYYIRGAFFKADSTQYFGSTLNNNGQWNSSASNFQLFYKIQGNGTTRLKFKIEPSTTIDPSIPYYFKIGRYSQAGSLSWSEQAPFSIQITPLNTSSPTPSPTPSVQLPTRVQLTEVAPCPASGEKEWIELYNDAPEQVELTDWSIQDSSGTQLSFSPVLQPFEYKIIELPRAILNNSGDTVVLLNDQLAIIDQMTYSNCVSTHSYIKHDGVWKSTYTAPVTNTVASTQNKLKKEDYSADSTQSEIESVRPLSTPQLFQAGMPSIQPYRGTPKLLAIQSSWESTPMTKPLSTSANFITDQNKIPRKNSTDPQKIATLISFSGGFFGLTATYTSLKKHLN